MAEIEVNEVSELADLRLTKSEEEIMGLMWKENRPLSRTEIIELLPERSWKKSSIHIFLNSMLEKDAIRVCGSIRTAKRFARQFQPTVTPEQYTLIQLRQIPGFGKNSLVNICRLLLEDVTEPEIYDQLGQLFHKKLLELEENETDCN